MQYKLNSTVDVKNEVGDVFSLSIVPGEAIVPLMLKQLKDFYNFSISE